jgi:endonuclease YncB( thermonuclease family)
MLTFRSRERIPCTILSFADGDTVLVVTECPVCDTYKKQYVRLKNIESYEVRSTEKNKALAIAEKWTTIYAGKKAELITTQNSSDKYGRIVGDIVVDGFHLTDRLVREGDAWYSSK